MLHSVVQRQVRVNHAQERVQMLNQIVLGHALSIRMTGLPVDGVVVVVTPRGVHPNGGPVQKVVELVRKVETYRVVQPMVLKHVRIPVSDVMEP